MCPNCGCVFVSGSGLLYHVKLKVCGNYPEAIEKMVIAELHANCSWSSPVPEEIPGPPAPTGTPGSSQHKTPAQLVAAAASRPGTPSRASPARAHAFAGGDPYAKLGPEERRNFEMEMTNAEEKYGGMMRQAMNLPVKEREEELARLKNSFNTKQSTLRRKYGVLLRERRPKGEIESERNRLVGTQDSASAPTPKRPRVSYDGAAASHRSESRPAARGDGLTGGLASTYGSDNATHAVGAAQRRPAGVCFKGDVGRSYTDRR